MDAAVQDRFLKLDSRVCGTSYWVHKNDHKAVLSWPIDRRLKAAFTRFDMISSLGT